MGVIAGKDFKLYYATTGFTAQPANDAAVESLTWVEAPVVQTVDQTSERTEISFQTRANGGQTQYLAGPLDESFEFVIAYDTADAFFNALKDAHINGNEIAILDVDGDYTAARSPAVKGWAGNVSILNFSKGEPIDDVATVNVTARPGQFVERDFTQTAT